MLKNTHEQYGSVAKFFHWLMALLIIFMLCFGFLMEGESVVNVHQLIGLLLLILVACRLIWKLFNPRPILPPSVSTFEKAAAITVQTLMYVCMFGMPLSGWIMSTAFGLIPQIGNDIIPAPGIPNNQPLGHIFQDTHNTLAFILIGLVCLHVLGALKHQFIDKDSTVLTSMLPRIKK